MQVDQHPLAVLLCNPGLRGIVVDRHAPQHGRHPPVGKQRILALQIGLHEHRHAVVLHQHRRLLHLAQVVGDIGLRRGTEHAGHRHGHRRNMHRAIAIDDDRWCSLRHQHLAGGDRKHRQRCDQHIAGLCQKPVVHLVPPLSAARVLARRRANQTSLHNRLQAIPAHRSTKPVQRSVYLPIASRNRLRIWCCDDGCQAMATRRRRSGFLMTTHGQ